MASTSGSFTTPSVNGGKNYMIVNWQLASQEVANNRSLINWQSYAHFTQNDSQLDNGYTNSNAGGLWSNGGRVKNFDSNYTTRDVQVASGSFWIGHNSEGNQQVSFSAGITYYGWGRSEGSSGAWDLPTIPRNSSGAWSKSLYTIGETLTINISRKSNSFTHDGTIQYPDGETVKSFSGVATQFNWTPSDAEIDTLYAKIPNAKKTSLGFDATTKSGSTTIGTFWQNVEMQADETVASPLFSNYTYKDALASTVAITGNDQYIIQGKSQLEVDISTANSATPRKSATMSKYTMAISNITQDVPFTTSAIAQNLGIISSSSSSSLVVSAVDSRGFTKGISKTVNVLPYLSPQITASANRVNNFETSTKIHFEAIISRLTIGSTDKNAVVPASGVQWRYKKTSDTAWGNWANIASTTSSGSVSTADFYTDQLDRNFAWNIQFKITDKLETATADILLSVGIPIMRIGLDGFVYNNEQPLMASHIGQIIQSTTLTTPQQVSAKYGGTWIAWGLGRVIVGMGSNGTTNYTTVEATGGSDNISLTTLNLPAHSHSILSGYGDIGSSGSDTYRYQFWGGNDRGWKGGNLGTSSVGSSTAFDARTAYQTAYQWKRTA